MNLCYWLRLALYAEMKEGLLAPSTDFASKPLRDELKCTSGFLPSYSIGIKSS
jgi:hypothetical protein